MVKTLRLDPAHGEPAMALDPARIGGISSAIALHLIAFGVLMMPAQVPIADAPPEQRIRVTPVDRTPPPPPPPIEVPVIERRPIAAAQKPTTLPPRREVTRTPNAAASTTPSTQDEAPTVATEGDHTPRPPLGGVDGGTSGGGERVTGIALQYLDNPTPAYPRDALREGLEGTVMLRVTVDERGRPIEVVIAASSGHKVLDRTAREQVLRRWTFVPAQRNGVAVRAVGTVPVVFRIVR